MTQSKNTSETFPLPEEPSSSTTTTAHPQTSAASVLVKLNTADNGFYAATPKLAYRAEYFAGGQNGNILIVKGRNSDEEFIVHGVYEISQNDFYLMPDTNFNPTNVFQGHFADVQLNCRLMAGCSEAFKFSSEDFSAILDNIQVFEKLIPRERDYETLSMIHNSLGHRSIKLTHSLFEAKADDEEHEKNINDEIDGDSNGSTSTADSLNSDFNMSSWPVADRCKDHLHELISTHNIQPLPAYDENHNLIPPIQYESKLKGVLVEVHMAICHHCIKSSKCDIFNAVLQELIVLAPPAAMPTSPFKCRCLHEGPSSEQQNKGKTPIRG
ncbi:hypothetical protein DFH29DRAFT_1004996 [Suillus ampliporus]|nr:hypothetical protein DFH29DRAFT_1004996 [Suillus ampliporus]